MKKLFFTLILTYFSFAGMAQLRFNEFYVSPNANGSNNEYFELFNPTGAPDNTDNYLVITYFERDNGTTKGFYVADLADATVFPGHVYLGAAGDPISISGSSSVQPDFNWNKNPQLSGGSFQKFVLNPSGNSFSSPSITASEKNDIFVSSQGNYLMMLFKQTGGVLTMQDGFIGGDKKSKLPSYVTSITATLSVNFRGTAGMDQAVISFSSFASQTINNLSTPSSGTDNGYTNCNGWKKISTTSDNSPKKQNGYVDNPYDYLSYEIIEGNQAMDTVAFQFTGGAATNFPMTVWLYVDKGTNLDDNGDGIPGDFVYNKAQDDFVKKVGVDAPNKLKKIAFDKIAGNYALWLVIDGGTCGAQLPYYIMHAQEDIVAPVNFASFNAQRNGSNVLLNWATASEADNKGYSVQRKLGSANWQNIAFVDSKAPGGTSTTALSYTFVDDNSAGGITQYRLLQMDNNGKAAYSEVRSVRGLNQSGKTTMFPNPSTDGMVNVIFEDAASLRNVMVSDMAGRTLIQYKNISSNSLQIKNLRTGLYHISIQNVQTGERIVEKLLVR